MTRAPIRRLWAERRGATLVEFAAVLPVMMILLMGFADLTYQLYGQAVLSGEVQRAARASTLQGNGSPEALAAIDAKVDAALKVVNKRSSFTAKRSTYSNYSEIGPEYYRDANGNGVYDSGECFIDVNGNNKWDKDPGIEGVGGDSDTTVYTGTLIYPRLFPIWRVIGWGSSVTLTSTTMLKNQPVGFHNDPPRTKCPAAG